MYATCQRLNTSAKAGTMTSLKCRRDLYEGGEGVEVMVRVLSNMPRHLMNSS